MLLRDIIAVITSSPFKITFKISPRIAGNGFEIKCIYSVRASMQIYLLIPFEKSARLKLFDDKLEQMFKYAWRPLQSISCMTMSIFAFTS